MDFASTLMANDGHGLYERITVPDDALPPLFLVYSPEPSDSGKIHSDVYARFSKGE